jgi:hypothetical protein
VLVNDMAAARAEVINREGLQAQIAYLLEAYGPGEIEHLALGDRARLTGSPRCSPCAGSNFSAAR